MESEAWLQLSIYSEKNDLSEINFDNKVSRKERVFLLKELRKKIIIKLKAIILKWEYLA